MKKNILKYISLASFAIILFIGCGTQESQSDILDQIQRQIDNLKKAHLNSDVDLADRLYHPNLILTSQSGTKYDKEVALKNIENTFESYVNADIEFLQVSNSVVLTNYINERKYKDFDKGRFRLTVLWIKHEGEWKIISMQSSKIKEPKRTSG